MKNFKYLINFNLTATKEDQYEERERDAGKNSNSKTIWTIIIILIIGIAVALILKQTILQQNPQFSPNPTSTSTTSPSPTATATVGSAKDLDNGKDVFTPSCVKTYTDPNCNNLGNTLLDRCVGDPSQPRDPSPVKDWVLEYYTKDNNPDNDICGRGVCCTRALYEYKDCYDVYISRCKGLGMSETDCRTYLGNRYKCEDKPFNDAACVIGDVRNAGKCSCKFEISF